MKIMITKEHLKLHEIAGKDETRYHLMGVNIDLELKEAAATDGHGLAFLPINNVPQNADIKRFLIPTNDCKQLLKIIKRQKIDQIELNYNQCDQTISCDFENEHHSFKISNYQTFPDYRQVMPKYNSEFSITINPELLLRIKKALSKNKNEGLKLEFKGKSDSIRVISNGNIVACLMPMRD